MAENVGSVFWEVEIDASGMLRGVRQIDDRLDDLNDNLNDTTRGIRRAFNPARIRRLAGGVAKAVGAATLAFTAFAAAIGQSGKELEVMARLTGVSIERMQALSFAAETMTISGEQLSDMAKDITERMGEFDSLDEGGFNDFIDVMGKTKDEGRLLAKQLETLSGPQVLQYLVTEMEKAGKSTGQISFALEGLASDSTKLIPLFRENGKLLGELESKFNKLASGISADTFKEYKNLSSNMGLATSSFKNFLAEALAPLVPAFDAAAVSIASFFQSFIEGSKEANEFRRQQEAINKLIDEGSTGSGRTRKKTFGSIEAKEINDLLTKNKKIEQQITNLQTKRSKRGPSSLESRIKQREEAEKTKKLLQEELVLNNKKIDQLKAQSAAAQEVFNIRTGTTPEVAASPSTPQTPFLGN